MPSETWWNLDESKRLAIIQASVIEFAQANFAQASLSQIVKQVGIAKGSMYQYFADKEDLYLYIVQLASDHMMAEIQQRIPLSILATGDVFKILREYFAITVNVAQEYPYESSLIQRALQDSGAQLAKVQAIGISIQRAFVVDLVNTALANKSLRSDIDPEVFVYFIQTILTTAGSYMVNLLHVHNVSVESEDYRIFFDQIIAVLDQGMRYRIKR
ncbi:MAG: TetR/AcrR family transcriptional regulator [Chloroflexota bacterium]